MTGEKKVHGSRMSKNVGRNKQSALRRMEIFRESPSFTKFENIHGEHAIRHSRIACPRHYRDYPDILLRCSITLKLA
jgi:hypothetical protein